MKMIEDECACGETVYRKESDSSFVPVIYDDEQGEIKHECYFDEEEHECANGCGTTVDEDGEVCGDCEDEDDGS
jgi:hypothetical protein